MNWLVILGNILKLIIVFIILIVLQKLGVFKLLDSIFKTWYTNQKQINIEKKRNRRFVRKLKKQARLNDEFIMAERRIPTRRVPGRTNDRGETVVQRAKRQKARQQQVNEFKSRIDKNVNSFVKGFSNINQLKTEAQNYFSTNVNDIPGELRKYFQEQIKSQIKKIERQRERNLTRLDQDITSLKRQLTETTKSNVSANLEGRLKAAQEVKNLVQEGRIIDYQTARQYMEKRGRAEGAQISAIEKQVEFQDKVNKKFIGKKRQSMTKQKQEAQKDVPVLMEEYNLNPERAQKLKQSILKETYPKFFGVLSKTKEPKTWAEKLERYRRQVIYDIDKSEKIGARIFQGVFVLGGVGVARGFTGVFESILNPRETIRGLVSAIKNPVKTIRAATEDFIVDPVGTVAQYYTYSKTLNLGVKAAKRSPVGRYVQEELFIKAQPKEIRPYVREIIKSSKTQEKINPFNVKKINKVDFAEVQSLTRAEAAALAKTLQKTDSVVFGSVASRTLSKGKTPLPKDVDIATSNINSFSKNFVQNLPKKLRKNYVIKGEKLVRKANNEALFDIKPLERLYPDKSILNKKGFLPVSGYVYDVKGNLAKSLGLKQKLPKRLKQSLEVPTQKIQKVEGIKLVGFGEQTTRKGLGTLQTIIEKNIKRTKDPQAFIRGLEIQVDVLKAAKPATRIGKITNKLKVKRLSESLKILKSRGFTDLLRKKTKGLSDQYPFLSKVKPDKLQKAINTLNKAKKAAKKIKKKSSTAAQIKAISELPKTLRKYAYSYLPKKVQSTILPKLPSQTKSFLKKETSKIKKSVIPSTIPVSKIKGKPKKSSPIPPSEGPSKPLSSLAKPKPSPPPSFIPSQIPSTPPPSVPLSKIPSLVPPVTPPPAKPKERKFIKTKISWKSKRPSGTNWLVNGLVKSKGKIKELQLKTTPNRAFKYMSRLVDNTLARSFQLKIIGITRSKDIGRQDMSKFRQRLSSNNMVLNFVERTKHAIDTPGEKRKLSVAKALKRKRKR